MKTNGVRGRKPKPIELTEDERARLIELSRRSKTANAVARRARIVLAAADGMGNSEMHRKLGVSIGTAVFSRVWSSGRHAPGPRAGNPAPSAASTGGTRAR